VTAVPELVPPDVAYQRSFVAAVAEDPDFFAGTLTPSVTALGDPEAFARYVAGLAADAEPESPRPDDHVPQTVLWWVDGTEFLARIGIRHRLTHRLRTWGGHIGYWTRPSARGRGHAGAAFRASLPAAYALGIDPALLTCDDDNLVSRRIIEGAGGVFEQQIDRKLLFWVPTGPWAQSP
jgi:predicted acetyltransferase